MVPIPLLMLFHRLQEPLKTEDGAKVSYEDQETGPCSRPNNHNVSGE